MARRGIEPESKVLCRRWVHSHEEDTAGEMVFRPADYVFPLSRGRFAFELREDGSAITSEPGAADRPRAAKGRWSLKDVELCLTAQAAAKERRFEIVSATRERLVVRRRR